MWKMHLNAFPVVLALLALLYRVQAQDIADGSAFDYELVRADMIDLAMGNDSISLDPFEDLLEKRQRFQCFDPGWVECPNVRRRCKPPAASCCTTGYYYYPGRSHCCPVGGTCSKSLKCCQKSCCPQSGTCGGDGYCSTRRWGFSTTTQTSTSTRTSSSTTTTTREIKTTKASTSTSTSTSTSKFTSRSTSTESECTVKPTANARRTWLDGFADVFQASEHQLEKRQRPFPKSCTTECHASGQRLPVVEFTSVRGETDELVKSMCAGMDGWYKRQKSGTNGRRDIWTDLARGEDVLTYGGPAKKNPDAADRRKDVQCKKFYKSECEALGKKRGVSMECDEYPPAMSLEGGGLATRMCVPAKQNSRTQGPQFRLFVKTCGLKRGDKFLLRLKGGCSRFNFPARREEGTHTVAIAHEDATFRDPNDDGSLTYVAVGLGDLEVGHYEIDANFNGTIREAVVLNQYGDEYASLDSPSESAKMSFDVTDDYYQPAALVAYTEHPVEVSYNGTVQPGNTAATPSPSETPSSAMTLGGSNVYMLAATLTLGLLQQML